MNEICDATKLAAKILKSNTEYIIDREIIDNIFKITVRDNLKENIRLTVIDSFYSTNMSKRLFGLVDLSDAIKNIGTDEEIKEQASVYIKTGIGKVNDILVKNYGIRKYGKDAGEARSLISKYLYFLMDHNFPIEDSLVKNYANTIFNHFGIAEINTTNLIFELAKTCTDQNCSYDEMDNLLWLFGKMINGSLSLIVNRESYIEIIEIMGMNQKIASKEFDKLLSEKLRKKKEIDKIQNLISIDLKEFLYFCSDVMSE